MSKKYFVFLNNSINQAIDFRETENLFATAMGNMKNEALKLTNSLSEAFGLAIPSVMQAQGTFKNMLSSIEGLAEESSTTLSNVLTKMSVDFSSLYNVSIDDAITKMQAALSRQVRPIRSVSGYDITQNVLGSSLEQIGIYDRTVSQLSEMEKRLLIIYTLQQQMGNSGALGDFAKTIEQPAQQLKVLQQQIQEVGRWLGAVFEATIGKILPYINAFTMVIKELIKAFALLVGYKMPDSSKGQNILDMMDDTADDFGTSLNDGIDKATKKVKNLLAPFDKVNVLTNPTDTSSSSSGSSSAISGIDSRILDSIKDYENGLEKVKMKATQIRDNIMEWLGFTKQVDKATGEVTWRLKEGWSNLKTILAVVGTLLGLGIISKLIKLKNNISESSGLLKGLTKVMKGLTKVMKSIKDVGFAKTVAKIGTNFKSWLAILGKVTVGIAGIAVAGVGIKGVYDSTKELTKGTDDLNNQVVKLGGSMAAAAAGGALVGSVIPVIGTGLGALIGAGLGATSAIAGLNAGMRELVEEDLYGSVNVSVAEWKEILDNTNISASNSVESYNNLKTTVAGLGESFNENANKLDFYGLKFGTLSQQISEEDAVNIKNAINDMCSSSSQIIEESTNYELQLWSNAFKDMSTLTEEEQKSVLQSIASYGAEQQEKLNEAQNNITKTYNHAIKTRGYLTDEEYDYIATQLQNIRDLTEEEMSKSQSNIEYYKAKFADKNQTLDKESYANFKTALEEYHKERLEEIETEYQNELNSAKRRQKNGLDTEDEYKNGVVDIYERRNFRTKELNEELEGIQDEVLASLLEKYEEVKDATHGVNLETKKEIEGIFKDLNIDTTSFEKDLVSNAKTASGEFSRELSRGLKVDGSSLYSSYNKVISNICDSITRNATDEVGIHLSTNIAKRLNAYKIRGYYDGGFVPRNIGQLFIANEPGNPELVGNIGGQTAVVNNNMIIEAIKGAMKSAIVEGMQLVFGEKPNGDMYVDIYIDGVFTERKLLSENDKHLLKTGKPVFSR